MLLRTIKCGFLLISLLGMGLCPNADDQPYSGIPQATVAMLPLANFTDNPSASQTITPLIKRQLSLSGFALADSAEVWGILREFRIRTAYGISLKEMHHLGSALDITYIALGSIDIYNESAAPEFGISLRLVRIDDGAIAWTASTGATGDDYTAILGLHKIDSITVLAGRVLADMFQEVKPQELTLKARESKKPAVAVIDFNGPEPGTYGGAIATTHVMNSLFDKGFDVIEPGVLRAVFRRFERFPRGEIDIELLRAIYDSLGVKYAITGSVDLYEPVLAGAVNSYPKIVLGARLLEASSGRIISSCELDADGRRLNVFGTGNVRSMERVASDAATKTIEKLNIDKHREL